MRNVIQILAVGVSATALMAGAAQAQGTWDGFYVGIQGGYQQNSGDYSSAVSDVTNDQDDDGNPIPDQTVISDSATPFLRSALPKGFDDGLDFNGFIGGAHVGYNFQTGGLVIGVEADLEFAGGSGNGSDDFAAFPNDQANLSAFRELNRELDFPGLRNSNNTPQDIETIISDGSIDPNFQGSLRARLGWATDRTLVYATGGLAFMSADYSVGLTPGFFKGTKDAGEFVPGDRFADSFSTTSIGFTVGAGLAFLLTDNISLGAEYRYTDFGSVTRTFKLNDAVEEGGGGATGVFDWQVPAKFDLETHAIRARLTYHFSGF